MTKKILMIAFLLLPALTGLWAETATEIMQRVIDVQKSPSSAMDIEMTLVASNGSTSTRRIQTLVLETSGLTSTITVFLEPASVRNTRFLTVENSGRADDQWIYLPSLRKVKRISASERDGSFMGSDFSYSDMSFSGMSVDDYDHTLLREETIDGRLCRVVQSVPKPGTDDSYSKRVSWVDKQTSISLRVEYYRTSSDLEKVLTATGLRTIDGRPSAESVTMTTTATDHRTVLEFKQVKYGIALDPGYFTTNFLETGRTR